jgi:hypothetical protein
VTQLMGPLAFFTISKTLVAELMSAIAQQSVGGPLDSGCVVPGAIAWDDCSCGALYVSTTNWFLSDNFPDSTGPGTRAGNTCELAWLVGDITIQVMRCMPQPEGRSISVECPRLEDTAKIMLADAYVTLDTATTVLCGLKDDDVIIDFSIGEETTQGPLGDCGGVELHVFVAIERR